MSWNNFPVVPCITFGASVRVKFVCPGWVQCLVLTFSALLIAAFVGCGGQSSFTTPNTPKQLKTITVSPSTAALSIGNTQQFTAKGIYSDGTTADLTSKAAWSVTNPALGKITASGLFSGMGAGITTVNASQNGITGTAAANIKIAATSKIITAIQISPASANIPVGGTQQFSAIATYSDASTENVTSTVTWTSTNPGVVTISASGLAKGIAPGSGAVKASIGTVSGSVSLTITPKVPTAIKVMPSTASIAAGSTQQFSATASYSDGSTANVTNVVAWTSGNASVATINPSGLAKAISQGSTAITASLNGINGTASLAVSAKTVTSITISPANASIAAGDTQQFTAIATYSDGTTANVTTTVGWTSANTAVASINSSGLAKAVGAGSTAILASIGGVNGTASLTVTAKTVSSIAVSPTSASFAAGTTQQFTATATYSDGSTANVTTTVAWASGNTAVATINSAGLATGVAQGSTAISASLTGVRGTAYFTVTPKTLSYISVSPSTDSNPVGLTVQFTATATYSDGTTANVTKTATWISSNSSVATITSAGLATGVATGPVKITASVNGISGAASLTITAKTITDISVSPANASFAMGQTQQFTAEATYSDGSTADVTSTVTWSAVNTYVATIDSAGLASGVAAGYTTITASQNGVNGTDSIMVTIAPGTGTNVVTWHFDNNRAGANASEQSLNPSDVNPQSFGKLFSYLVDGYVYAEPLVVSNVTINGTAHNVVYVATENDSVYAFDADNYGNGTPLWKVSLLRSGERPQTTDPDIQPYIGITSTPVIDLASNTMYVVSVQDTSSASTFRLNALDITTGAQKFGSPVTIQASVPGTSSEAVNGVIHLTTACIQRAALLLANGSVYMGFGGCDSGWLVSYDAKTLQQTGVFNASPNQTSTSSFGGAGGVWMGGGGPAADSAGNVYITTGNGPWDGKAEWGDTVLKFNSTLQIQDYFTPDGYGYMNCEDADLAAGGIMLIPGTSLAVAGGKTGKMYVVNTNNMGHHQANDAGAFQTLWFEANVSAPYSASCTDIYGTHTTYINSYEIFGTSAYFNGSAYLGISPTLTTTPAGVRQFEYSGKLVPGAYTSPSVLPHSKGTTPFVSANGTSNGIVWMLDQGEPIQKGPGPSNATLRAYDASHLTTELYDSSENSADVPGRGIKFTSPVVANGKVYISTAHDPITTSNPRGELDVYGLK